MKTGITATHGVTIGLDVSDRITEACTIDEKGEWVESQPIPTMQAGNG